MPDSKPVQVTLTTDQWIEVVMALTKGPRLCPPDGVDVVEAITVQVATVRYKAIKESIRDALKLNGQC